MSEFIGMWCASGRAAGDSCRGSKLGRRMTRFFRPASDWNFVRLVPCYRNVVGRGVHRAQAVVTLTLLFESPIGASARRSPINFEYPELPVPVASPGIAASNRYYLTLASRAIMRPGLPVDCMSIGQRAGPLGGRDFNNHGLYRSTTANACFGAL